MRQPKKKDPKICGTLFFSTLGHITNTLLLEFGQKLNLAKGVTLAAHPGQTLRENLTILKPQLVTINMNMIGCQKLWYQLSHYVKTLPVDRWFFGRFGVLRPNRPELGRSGGVAWSTPKVC